MKELPPSGARDMKEFAAQAKYKVEVPTSRHMQLEVGTFDKSFYQSCWSVIGLWCELRGNPRDLLPKDASRCLMWSKPEMHTEFYGPGFGITGASVLFPICTRLTLIGAFEIKEGAINDLPESAHCLFNGAQIAYAERQVYARNRNFKYSMQVSEEPRKASRLIDDKRFRKGTSNEE